MQEWSTMFTPSDADGNPIPPEKLPLVETLNAQRPAHGSLYIDSKKSGRVRITITSIPIEGKPDRYLGSMALFWKNEAP
jgi:hypothetical protein